jgi:hypothetical protein
MSGRLCAKEQAEKGREYLLLDLLLGWPFLGDKKGRRTECCEKKRSRLEEEKL